ncbi:hypothetical protein C0J52_27190 [Blattella germanica]|nr:hypothetical protein C0J52_27190 [Blattella germanica]
MDIGSGTSEDEAYCAALSDIADNGKIDISVVKFILNQKDILIDELHDILTDHVALLKQCAVPTSNVPSVTTHVLEDTVCRFTRSAVKEDLIPKQKCVKPEVVRKKPKRVVVVGNKLDKENKSINLQGIPKSVSLHVFRLAPDTTVDQTLIR